MVAVEVAGPTVRVLLVAAHAPCRSNNRSEEEITKWWQQTNERIRTWRKAPRPVVLMIDANVRMGFVEDTH
eukprot:9428885-Alexandrium_andersonii.AAC.1